MYVCVTACKAVYVLGCRISRYVYVYSIDVSMVVYMCEHMRSTHCVDLV